jgi:hypothetical protein
VSIPTKVAVTGVAKVNGKKVTVTLTSSATNAAGTVISDTTKVKLPGTKQPGGGAD